ncbi:MAG: nickel pincer cofactor biosynthesis protein LarC [Deltaproteobacteria bacterium]|nr:nickel pincer cofactor biosynthesis protein LarC [Deltaproteobacteria bacterium]
MNLVYFDCFAGISGDMTLGALIDLGVPQKYLVQELEKLAVHGYSLRVSRVQRSGITGRQVQVKISHHEHHHRTFRDIEKIIVKSPLKASVKERSLAVFRLIAEAEGKVHNTKAEAVHFHEVGAIDSIVDIAGCMIGLEYLGIERFAASAVPTGGGFVQCQHGVLPVPAPATVLLLKGIPVYDNGIKAELVTPTGAAILAALCESFGAIPPMTIQKTGYGAGSRELTEVPNMLRLILGNALQPGRIDTVVVLEATIDDMSPELAGYAMERLFEAGALDVAFTPVYMKKNRPGMLMTVICTEAQQALLTAMVFAETTTAGVRSYRAGRSVLQRREGQVDTQFGKLKVKLLENGSGAMRPVPEYEECRRIAKARKVPLREVYAAVAACGALENINKRR